MEKETAVDIVTEIPPGLEISAEYKYIQLRRAQIGVTYLKASDTNEGAVITHANLVQFLPKSINGNLHTIPTVTAIASIEMDVDTAKNYYELLGNIIAAIDKKKD